MEKLNAENIKQLARKEVLNFSPYIPGKPIEELKRELGIKGRIIKLASNENSLGTPSASKNAIRKCIDTVYRYPDGSSFKLRQAIAKKHKVTMDSVILGSGSDEIIELIGKTFFNIEDEIIVSEHAFIRYKMAGDLMGCRVVAVPMKNFTHDLDAMLRSVNGKTKAVFIANPNNPTGTYNKATELKNFLSKLTQPDKQPFVIIDEAYFEYAHINKDYPDSMQLMNEYEMLISLRTFSKIYGLAGLRAGYAVCSPLIVEYLDRIRPPFNINLLAQAAALASVSSNSSGIKKVVKVIEQGKGFLYDNFDLMNLPYIKSAGNFILIDVSPREGREVFNALLKEGVIVRAMDEYDFPNHIRVTVGNMQENKIFINALKKISG